MAKKKKIIEEQKSEPVTNSCSGKRPIGPSGDQLVKVDANSNHLDSGEIVLSQYDIEKLIIVIRDKGT